MSGCLFQHTVVPGHAYSALDIDSPGTPVVAVAWLAHDGWRVGVGDGQTVAEHLTQRRALSLMHRTAHHELNRTAALEAMR